MVALRTKLNQALAAVRARSTFAPRHAIILGTGLGALADAMHVDEAVEYTAIPHMPTSTVESHTGRLLLGTLDGVPVVAMQGRFHLYEGYTAQDVTFGVRLMHALGAHTLLVANAAGGLHPDFRRGDVMIITDHINLQTANPLAGPHDPQHGPRFPDMSEAYARRLVELGVAGARACGIAPRTGVYVGVTGPNLETRAEYRFLRLIGGDAVGMSTVPEVIVARQLAMEIFGVSVITDECDPDALAPTTAAEIIAAAGAAEPKLSAIVRHVCTRA